MSERLPRVLIAGCGYVGLALARHLAQNGFEVFGLRRNPKTKSVLKANGASPVFADLTKPETLRSLPQVDYVVSCQAPRQPRGTVRTSARPALNQTAPDDGTSDDYRSTYLNAAEYLVSALASRPPRKYIAASSTSVYGDASGAWVDETTEPCPNTENGRILLEAEKIVLAAPFPSLVLRFGGIYGPGRNRLSLLEQGMVSARDPGYINHIHVEDAVRLIHFLLERGEPRHIYLGVDHQPVLRSEFYGWLTEQFGVNAPEPAGSNAACRTLASKRCSSQKVRDLGFTFKYPSYRANRAAPNGTVRDF